MTVNGSHHLITIKVPVPEKSHHEANKVIAGYSAELDALYAKLPKGAEHEDHIRKPRGSRTPAAAE